MEGRVKESSVKKIEIGEKMVSLAFLPIELKEKALVDIVAHSQ